MRSTLVATSVAVLVTGSLLAGCGSDDEAGSTPTPSTGDSPGRHRAQCIVSDPEGEVILHPGSFVPDQRLVLRDAALEGADNLEVVERAVVRFTGRATVQGIVQDYPPLKTAGLADSLADWDSRRDLPGLVLGPDDGQQAVLVAVRLADPTRPGHLVGVSLRADGGSTSYAQPVLIEPHGALCTVAEYDSTLDWVP
ncbi:hypothetical protein [Nocardioides plantarum]|uniref:Lipoprotein n=1 Tax=Nocardioides plantarum TaxID=29299 RepID=A0ABV5KDR2_9ACTN|nr:hypothetical protein [Nocardioides plantarum]